MMQVRLEQEQRDRPASVGRKLLAWCHPNEQHVHGHQARRSIRAPANGQQHNKRQGLSGRANLPPSPPYTTGVTVALPGGGGGELGRGESPHLSAVASGGENLTGTQARADHRRRGAPSSAARLGSGTGHHLPCKQQRDCQGQSSGRTHGDHCARCAQQIVPPTLNSTAHTPCPLHDAINAPAARAVPLHNRAP
jgi:hypothetical protein